MIPMYEFILSGTSLLWQVEKEYGDSAYGSRGKSYIKWSAGMAVSLDTGVPWVMCQQSDAPDPIVSFSNHLRIFNMLSSIFSLWYLTARRSILAMDSTVINSPQILITSPKCGLRIGVDGEPAFLVLSILIVSEILYFDMHLFIRVLSYIWDFLIYLEYQGSLLWRCCAFQTRWRPGICCCTLFPARWNVPKLLYGTAIVCVVNDIWKNAGVTDNLFSLKTKNLSKT